MKVSCFWRVGCKTKAFTGRSLQLSPLEVLSSGNTLSLETVLGSP